MLRVAIIAIAGIFALGAEGQEEVAAGLQAALFEDRPQHILGGAGIGRAFQNDELAGPQVRPQRVGRC